jgi:hypothetical protein
VAKSKPIVKEVRNYKHFHADCFLGDLVKMPWHVIYQDNNPKECCRVWKSFFNEVLNIHAPIHKKKFYPLDYTRNEIYDEKQRLS